MAMHAQAALPRFRGPFYPKAIAELAAVLDGKRYSKQMLENAVRDLPGFCKCSAGESSDGYDWFALLEFRDQDGLQTVIVAVPYSQDWDGADGVQLDRSPAIYVTGIWTEKAGNELLREVAAALQG
jgi:hypothetical protein